MSTTETRETIAFAKRAARLMAERMDAPPTPPQSIHDPEVAAGDTPAAAAWRNGYGWGLGDARAILAEEAPKASEDDEQAKRLVEIGRCLHSTMGGLEAICDALPDGHEQGVELRGLIEAGLPEVIAITDQAIAAEGAELPDERRQKSFARGYQSMVLLRRETAGQKVSREDWREDPEAFMERLEASDAA